MMLNIFANPQECIDDIPCAIFNESLSDSWNEVCLNGLSPNLGYAGSSGDCAGLSIGLLCKDLGCTVGSSATGSRAGGGAILVLSSEADGRVRVLASCNGAGNEGADIGGCAIERVVLNGAGNEGLFVRIDGLSMGISIVARAGYGCESVGLTGEKISWL